jgi:hypothetical protein
MFAKLGSSLAVGGKNFQHIFKTDLSNCQVLHCAIYMTMISAPLLHFQHVPNNLMFTWIQAPEQVWIWNAEDIHTIGTTMSSCPV